MADWHVDQNIVCVEDIAHDPRKRPDRFPAKDAVYTIRAIRPNPDAGAGSPVGFLLAEIINPHCIFSDGQGEIHFGCDAFRPIKRADLTGLRALLIGDANFSFSHSRAKVA